MLKEEKEISVISQLRTARWPLWAHQDEFYVKIRWRVISPRS